MNTGNINNTDNKDNPLFGELARFVAIHTSENEFLQNWMTDNYMKQGYLDVTPFIRFAQSASIHAKGNNALDFEFTDLDNNPHHRVLTEEETTKLKALLSDDTMDDDKKQFKLTQFFTGTSASILAQQTFSDMMSQGFSVSNTLHR